MFLIKSDFLAKISLIFLSISPLIWINLDLVDSTLFRTLFYAIAAILLLINYLLKKYELPYPRYVYIILALLIYGLVTTTLLSSRFADVFFGTYNNWFGSASIISLLIVGFLGVPLISKKVLYVYYLSTVTLAIGSLLFNTSQLLEGQRLSGLVYQPAILAAIVGTNFILGFYLIQKDYDKKLILFGQSVLFFATLLTQSRAAIIPLTILTCIVIIKLFNQKDFRLNFSSWRNHLIAFIGASVFAVPLYLGLSRAINISQLVYAATYRWDLASHSIKIIKFMPMWGLGPGAISDWFLDIGNVPSSIMKTINQEFLLPSSSHTILLDKLIEYGWITAFCYIAFILLALWQLWQKRHIRFYQYIFLILSFVVLQLSITVPRVEIEIIFWSIISISLLPIKHKVIYE